MIKMTALSLFLFSTSVVAANSDCHILLAGDSTMQKVNPAKNPDFGWGQVLPLIAKKNTVINNHAKGGRSTRTFIEEGRWKNLLNEIKQDSWVFIQFGHNDASYKKKERYTAPVDFQLNLEKFVKDVRTQGGKPLLITPVMRRWFDDAGKLRDAHGIYPSLVRQVASGKNVPLIDLFESSSSLLVDLGVKKSLPIFSHVKAGAHSCCPEGREDNTHFSQLGAKRVSALVVEEIKHKKIMPLASCFL
ncbi:MAG: rhamnogalacturonan acetylesterase [Spongiibacteraceae bacterium]|nr:rhamnogalacturonan acetylesterase [Spongiibacteraceae bacterium]